MQAYQNVAIDYFYMGKIEKAEFYDNKYKQGGHEGPDSIVRKVAIQKVK